MSFIKEKVILISSVPYKDSDIVASFLSAANGKLTAMIYRGKEIGGESSFMYQAGDLLEIEYQFQEVRDFIKMKNLSPLELIKPDQYSYHRFVFHSYLLDVISRVSKPAFPAPELFDLILANNKIDWSESDNLFAIGWSLWRLIQYGGIDIDFSQCHDCGLHTWKLDAANNPAFRKQAYALSRATGGLRCLDCQPESNDMERVTSAMVKLIWLFENGPIDQPNTDKIPPEYSLPLIALLNRYLLSQYEINPKSLPLFESVFKSSA